MRLSDSALGHLRRHAVGYAALFVALGGTSYGAVNLPKASWAPLS